MSYPFEQGGETLWDAGYHSGQLYASLAWGAAGFFELPSGLSDTPQGSCEIDPPVFQSFVEQLYRLYASTDNDVLHGLAHGLLVTSLVLLKRAGGEIDLRPEHEAALQEQIAQLGRSMA
ncbi:hypothetical protein M2271_005514 [Streptomyces sp. LBL]|uniref:DUF6086 family protein n=1 Tax=Streptomyces sp. LBL TaxID=2940562 RepID=UPI002474B910|nr:DUF6086 family protein [Streptomyces sp. LBL]MDH6627687.1 hypothetical protein [Streptomyces sp. LBL]